VRPRAPAAPPVASAAGRVGAWIVLLWITVAPGIGLALGGCGGAKPHHRSGPPGRSRPPHQGAGEEGRGGARGIARADQIAYYQLATTTGFLCASAGTARVPHAGPDRALAHLAGAARRASAVHPGDGDLASARALLVSDLQRWRTAAGGAGRRRLAPAVLADCGRLQRSLNRFLTRHRGGGLSGQVPD